MPAVLVITSGDRRVDEKKVEALVGKIWAGPTPSSSSSARVFPLAASRPWAMPRSRAVTLIDQQTCCVLT
jgi:hypothetical protein